MCIYIYIYVCVYTRFMDEGSGFPKMRGTIFGGTYIKDTEVYID